MYYITWPEKGIENWQLAIDSYSESLKIFTEESDPIVRAGLLNSRGTMYQNLAMMNLNVQRNSDLALKDIRESFKIFTLSKYPEKYATGKYNEGVTYMKLYDLEQNEIIRQQSISAFKEAANLFNKKSKEYYDCMFNLGNIYMPLEKTDYTVSDCNNAIESY